jgi:hypothetical protein
MVVGFAAGNEIRGYCVRVFEDEKQIHACDGHNGSIRNLATVSTDDGTPLLLSCANDGTVRSLSLSPPPLTFLRHELKMSLSPDSHNYHHCTTNHVKKGMEFFQRRVRCLSESGRLHNAAVGLWVQPQEEPSGRKTEYSRVRFG